MTPGLSFEPTEHRYAWNGVNVPSVTQVLKDMRVAPPYPPDRGKLALGRAVHKCCELFLLDRLDVLPDDEERYPGTSPVLWPYLDAFRQKVEEYKIQPLRMEERVYNDLQGYAGTLDLNCRIFGRDEAIFDFKTGRPPECTALQTAAYDMALNRLLGMPERHRPRRRFALHLFESEVEAGGRARVTEFTDPFDYDAFIGIFTHWKWANRRGIKT